MKHSIGNFLFSPWIRAVAICTAANVAFIPASAGSEGPGAVVALKLDYDLVPRLDSPGVNTWALADKAHPSELRDRVLKVQDQLRSMAQSNQDRARLLEERQRVLAGIQGIVRAQDKMINVLKTEIERPAAIMSPPPAPAALAPPPAAPAAVMPLPSTPLRIGPVEIPSWLQRWLVESVLGAVIVILLGVTFHLRASAAAKDAELAALSSTLPPSMGSAIAEKPVAAPPAPPLAVDAEPKPTPAAMPEREASASAAATANRELEDEGWTEAAVQRKAADPDALEEADTLIDAEEFDKARLLLQEFVNNNPSDPEARIRLLHVESVTGDSAKAAEEEAALSQIMDGPMSDTMYRVKELGRSLLPGHPLFEDAATTDEAKKILGEKDQKKSTSNTQAEDLNAELEPDGEGMDFLSDIFGDDEELAKNFSQDPKPTK